MQQKHSSDRVYPRTGRQRLCAPHTRGSNAGKTSGSARLFPLTSSTNLQPLANNLHPVSSNVRTNPQLRLISPAISRQRCQASDFFTMTLSHLLAPSSSAPNARVFPDCNHAHCRRRRHL